MKPTVRLNRPGPEGPEGLEVLRVAGARGSIPVHVHASWCLVLVEAGVRSIRTGASRLDLGPGQAALIPPGVAHACSSGGGGCDFTAVSVPDRLMPSGPREVRPSGPLLLPPDSRLRGALSGDTVDMPALPGLMAKLSRRVRVDRRGLPTDPPVAAVRRAMAALDAPEGADLPLDALSHLAGTSPFHLCRTFRTSTGVAPMVYRTLARLRRARRLLAKGEPLAAVAAECGFFDQSHFNQYFKKYMGMTPGRYARACT